MDTALPDDWFLHADFLRGLARRLVHDEATADDLVQDTLVASIQGRPQGHPDPRAWLGLVMRRLAGQRRKSEAARRDREARTASPESLPDDAQIVERMELGQQVMALVLELPETQRQVIHLRFHEGLSARRVSELTGVPLETVRTREKRAVAHLRRRLGGREGEVSPALLLPLLSPLLGRPRDVAVATTAAKTAATTAATTATTMGAGLTTIVAMKKALCLSAAALLAGLLGTTLLLQEPEAHVTDLPEAPVPARLAELGEEQEAPGPGPQQGGGRELVAADRTPPADDAEPATDGILLDAAVILVSPDGVEDDSGQGRLSVGIIGGPEKARYAMGPAGLRWEEVEVKGGRFQVEVPRESSLAFDGLRFLYGGEEVAATAEEMTIVTPEDGQLILRAKLLERSTLRVVDAATGIELSGVELRVMEHTPTDHIHPGDAPSVRVLHSSTDSPIQLPALDSRCAYWGRAPGYAWNRITIEHRSRGGERVLELQPGGRLTVRLAGQVPEDCFVRLRDMSSSRRAGELRAGRDGSVTFEDLLPGKYLVRAEQHSFSRALLLGFETTLLEVGSDEVVEIALYPPPVTASAAVPLAGELIMDPVLAEQELVMQLYHQAERGQPRQEVEVLGQDNLEPVPGRPGHFRWSAGEVLPGRYLVWVGPLHHRQIIEVRAPGTTDARIELDPPAWVQVRFLDAASGLPVVPEESTWMDGSLGHTEYGNRSYYLKPDPETGTSELLTSARPITITTYDPRFGEQRQDHPLQPGQNTVDVRLERVEHAIVTVFEGAAQLDFFEDDLDLRVRRVDGEHPTTGRRGDGSHEYLSLAGPGEYVFELTVGEEHQPVEARRLQVGPGEGVLVRFEVERR